MLNLDKRISSANQCEAYDKVTEFSVLSNPVGTLNVS